MPNKFKAIKEENLTSKYLRTAAGKLNIKADEYISRLERNLKDEIHYDTGTLADAIKVDYSRGGHAIIYFDSQQIIDDPRNLEQFDYSMEYWKGRGRVKGIINRGSKYGDSGKWKTFHRWNGDPFVERAIERTNLK